MKLSEVLAVMKHDIVIQVIDARSIAVFHGEVSIAGGAINDRYLNATVATMYLEFYKGWGKAGITIIVQP